MRALRKIAASFLDRPVKNLFNTNFEKNVLISYITRPYRSKELDKGHTNAAEAIRLGHVFKELGFNVDVYHFNSKSTHKIHYEKYDLLFGFGTPLCRYFHSQVSLKKKAKVIYYGTGAHGFMQNINTIKRAKEVFQKKGTWLLESSRLVHQTWPEQTGLCDAIITMGNKTIQDSYKYQFSDHIYSIPVTYNADFPENEINSIIENKNYKQRKFLWFGSSGLVHKGLDLTLEAFAKRPELELYVCGPINKEPQFEKTFYKELYETNNIHTFGFLNIQSEQFKKVISECTFALLPSCSESEPSSLVNVMVNGLIPLSNKEAGYKNDWKGIEIETLTIDGLDKAINVALEIPTNELKERSIYIKNFMREHNNLDIFEKIMKKNLEHILSL